MEILYKKLWKLLIDRQMTQTEMRRAAGISSSTLAMMNKNLPVTTAVLEKICKTMNCRPTDIVSAKTLRSLKTRKVTECPK
ncbi:MAG: helix-turn-helix transcriptional regulator [Lentisphaeria bacterium]|nr:helix-turn-helix transcriptional regulator [Lentisphaeria bacterium]